ncbi:MAG: Uma2 family endonuclease [Anaerolineaceae bacterium]|nr:Uma2 family endonuclease [Anaerolineaceae bacterium]
MTIREKMTIAQYEAFLALPENANRRFELVFGEVIEKMPTQLHAYIIQMLSGFLFVFLRQNPLGYALIEARYRLPDDEENDLIPDLSFVVKGRGALVRSGAAPYMPDLAVEAQSEGQSERFMLDKALRYLANGTRMVWIIYSTRQIVEVLTPTDRRLLTMDDMLTGGNVLPGFNVAVRDLFPLEDEGM